jgi:multidrug efflux system outer membrane protein
MSAIETNVCFGFPSQSVVPRLGAVLPRQSMPDAGAMSRDRAHARRGVRGAAALSLCIAILAGCAGKRDAYVVPEVPIPNQFRQSTLAQSAAAPAPEEGVDDALRSNINFVDEMLAEWWQVLGSKELDSLMDQAIANNADLRIATLRMAQARARAEQAHADEFPVITAPAEARVSSPAGGVGTGTPGQSNASRRLYQAGLRADWRLDVFGERLALTESAQMQLWRSIYQRDDTRRLLAASIASTYVEYLSLNDRLRVARETEIVLRGMLESVDARLKGGDATITELEQQRAAVYSVRATIPALELQRENTINSLAQLVGTTPGSLALSHRGIDTLNFPRVLPGVPANLLLRRPDVRVVEARLLSADADIDVARTRLLPAIDLSSQVGYGSVIFSRLFQPHNLAWNAIATLSATIFDHGKKLNEVNFSKAVHEEMVETYVRVLYGAIRETEDAIAAVQMNGKRLDAQNAATRASKRAWDLSREAYREGAIDYLVLLDTERTYHRNLDEFHRVSMERHKGLVSLFSSLGGGVPRSAPVPARGAPQGDAGDEYSIRAAARAPIQFLPHALQANNDQPFWLVELSGLQDRDGVTHVWRDLINRFPDLMSDRIILPRLQGSVANEREEKAAWYRLFIAKFSSAAAAETFCARLATTLIRCRALAHTSPEYQDGPQGPVHETARTRAPASSVLPASSAVTENVQSPRPAAPGIRTSAVTNDPMPARASAVRQTNAVSPRQPIAEPLTLATTDLPRSDPAPMRAPIGLSPAVSPAVSSPARGDEPRAMSGSEPATKTLPAPPANRAPDAQPSASRSGYAVQLITSISIDDATLTSRKWTTRGLDSYVYPVIRQNGDVFYTVRTGIYSKVEQAAAQAAAIRRDEQIDAIAVPITLDEAGRPAPAAIPKTR